MVILNLKSQKSDMLMESKINVMCLKRGFIIKIKGIKSKKNRNYKKNMI